MMMLPSSDWVDLCDGFSFNNAKNSKAEFEAKLSPEGVLIRSKSEHGSDEQQLLRMEDIVGSRYGSAPPSSAMQAKSAQQRPRGLSDCNRYPLGDNDDDDDDAEAHDGGGTVDCFLYLYAYRKCDASKRCRTVEVLRFNASDRFRDNVQAAQNWHLNIKLMKSPAIAVSCDRVRRPQREKAFLILLNPKAGLGKAKTHFEKCVVPLLHEADAAYDLHLTEYKSFARQFVHTKVDLLQHYRGIIIVAGDGIFFEVINGLLERPDWQQNKDRMPIGIVPCGSGNGLAKSIAHICQEPYEPEPILNATLTCLSGRTAPLDVVRVETESNGKRSQMYSFLSVGWGFIADVDIESEYLRSWGAQRFSLWSVYRLISLRTYAGKLYYLRSQRSEARERNEQNDHNGQQDKKTHIGAHDEHSQALYGPPSNGLRKVQPTSESSSSSSSCPPLEEWQSIEGDFVMVHAAYTSHLSADCFFAPQAGLNDGLIHLVIIRAGVTRLQLLRFLLRLESGTQFAGDPCDHIRLETVTAFRIEPRNHTEGIITVDGERVDCGVVHAQIMPGMIQVMVPK